MSSDENNSWWDSVDRPESIEATCKTMKLANLHEFLKILLNFRKYEGYN